MTIRILMDPVVSKWLLVTEYKIMYKKRAVNCLAVHGSFFTFTGVKNKILANY